MVPDAKSVEICLDKLLFSVECEQLGLPVIKSKLNLEDFEYPSYVVKERFGAGAQSIAINVDRTLALNHASTLNFPLFQPYFNGTEISVDSYVTKSGLVKGIITRIRRVVNNGESVITETFIDERLNKHLVKIIEKLDLYGHIILQLIIGINNEINIIECNSRFGGASTLSIEAGLDSFYWFLHETNGLNIDQLPFQRKEQKITQIRFPQDMIIYDNCL